MNIKLMNKIAKVGTDIFEKDLFTVAEDVNEPSGIMVRSASLHEMEFPKSLLAIARAGAGVNNIPIDKCTENGVVVFNTPGANANGVKELAICALLLASRDVVGGVNWAESLNGEADVAKVVEKGKSKFAGCELMGKKLGVIGLGAIGGMVANAAVSLGMKVVGYDAYLSVGAALKLSSAVSLASSYEEIYKSCDYITLHVPATSETKNMINKDTLALMKDGVKIINLARADLVSSSDIKDAIAEGKVSSYVVDFPTESTLGCRGIVNIPHLGASTGEAEDNCAVMAAEQLRDYLLYGNVKNSVNFPNLNLGKPEANRVAVMYKKGEGALSSIVEKVSSFGADTVKFASAEKGNNGYLLLDTTFANTALLVEEIKKLDCVISAKNH